MANLPLPALACALLLAGCASTPADSVSAKLPETSDYSKNPFVPVNLYVNPNEHVDGSRAELLEYAAARLVDSGAFLRVDRGTQRWLYTLQLKFRPQVDAAAVLWPRRLLSVLSLGLWPVPVPRTEFLEAEIFLEPDPVAKFTYVQPFDDTMSLYQLGDPNREARAAVDLLLKRLMAELAATKVVPRAKDFEQPPTQPRKPDKPRPKGQPT